MPFKIKQIKQKSDKKRKKMVSKRERAMTRKTVRGLDLIKMTERQNITEPT